MKKILGIFAIVFILCACSSTSLNGTYKFKDLTICYPDDANLNGKIYSTYSAALNGEDFFITIDKIINDKGYSFKEMMNKIEQSAIFDKKCDRIVNDDKHVIYKYDDYALVSLYQGSDNSYYCLIAQGDKDSLKENYSWILKSFKNIKIA